MNFTCSHCKAETNQAILRLYRDGRISTGVCSVCGAPLFYLDVEIHDAGTLADAKHTIAQLREQLLARGG